MVSRFYMGNLARDASEESLAVFLLSQGVAARHVALVLNPATGQSRGFAFVVLDGDAGDAETAMRTLADAAIDGRMVTLHAVAEREASLARH